MARKITKKKPAKKKISAKKKVMAKKKSVVKKIAKKVKAKHLGKVVHYYDRIGVAIIELKAPIKLGDSIVFKRGEMELPQTVSSMQIEHESVPKAKKGDVIGLKVDKEMQKGTMVMPM